jgi:cytochrome b pre-mRNA-processing protein 3
MALARLFGGTPKKKAAADAYIAIVEQARNRAFFEQHTVPDTLDGRFELIALHAFLLLERLHQQPAAGQFCQAVFDAMFSDMDRGLRELGAGDLSVGKQVKRMATGFYGRVAAYRAGLAELESLDAALERNLFGTVPAPEPAAVQWFARYLRNQTAALARHPIDEFLSGNVPFAAVDDDPILSRTA